MQKLGATKHILIIVKSIIMNKKNQILQILIVSLLTISCNTDHFTESKDGLQIAYSAYGKGADLLVFVHGWSTDRSFWNKQIDFFSNDYKVVTLDLGGHGESGTLRTSWTISSLGDDVAAVVELFEYEKLYIVGHSMGGMVIVDAASKIRSPNIELYIVDVLKNKYWPIPEESFEDFIKPFREDFQSQTKQWVSSMFIEESNPKLVDSIRNDMASAPPEIAIPVLKDLWVRNFDSTITQLRDRGVQLTLINSYHGKTNEEELKEIGFDITYIPGTGHFIPQEVPGLFNKHLQKLIQSNK